MHEILVIIIIGGLKPSNLYFYSEEWYCGFICSPEQEKFTKEVEGGVIFYVCRDFCWSFFEACQDATFMGYSLKAIYTRYQDFCYAQALDKQIIRLQDKDCFGM
jgi:hypothetical protein